MSLRTVSAAGVGILLLGVLHAAGCASSSDDPPADADGSTGSTPDGGSSGLDGAAIPETGTPDAPIRCEGDAGVCTPFTTRSVPCGICGTKTEVCQTDCQYAAGACTDEKVGGCRPGFVKTSTVGCTGGEVTSQVCDSTCTFGSVGPCGPPGTLTIAATVGGVVSSDFTLTPLSDQIETIIGDPYNECPTAIQPRKTSYSWVKLINPTSATAKVSAWESRPDGATTDLDTIAAWYDRTTIPVTTDERRQCTNWTSNNCTSPPCFGNEYPGFVNYSRNDSRITIPPNSFVMVYTGAYHPDETGTYTLNARTDAL